VPDSIITYKVTDTYSAEHDRGLAWDDPALAIAWPEIANPETLSAKDRAQPRLTDLPPVFTLGD
jgi:dTDP-4-dehydrorhamnose 3,5-epimerase